MRNLLDVIVRTSNEEITAIHSLKRFPIVGDDSNSDEPVTSGQEFSGWCNKVRSVSFSMVVGGRL